MLLVTEGKDAHNNGRHTTLEKPREENGEIGKIKSLGAIQHHGHWIAALPQIMLQYLLDQPGDRAGAALPLETKL